MRTLSVVALLAITLLSCGFEAPTAVAVIPIRLQDQTLYVKRQMWGFNGDRTVLSLSPDWRDVPRAGDREWCALGPPHLRYRVEGRTLHLWEESRTCWKLIGGDGAQVPVIIHEANALDLARLERQLTAIGPHDWPLRKVRFWERW